MNDATKNTPKKNKRSNPHDSAITMFLENLNLLMTVLRKEEN